MNTRESILIDKFLRGELTAREAHDWEKIKKKPRVLKESAFRRDLIVAAIPEGRDSLKKELQALEMGLINPETRHEIPQENKTPVVKALWARPRLWAAAAALVLLCATIFYFSQKTSLTPEQELYAEAWKPYPNEITLRVRGDGQSPNLLDQAMLAYEKGEFSAAISMFMRIAEPRDSIEFYRANAYLAQGKIGVAKGTFEQILSVANHPYRLASEWYLALIDVHEGNWKNARTKLGAISDNSSHPFASNAQKLLKQLDDQ